MTLIPNDWWSTFIILWSFDVDIQIFPILMIMKFYILSCPQMDCLSFPLHCINQFLFNTVNYQSPECLPYSISLLNSSCGIIHGQFECPCTLIIHNRAKSIPRFQITLESSLNVTYIILHQSYSPCSALPGYARLRW